MAKNSVAAGDPIAYAAHRKAQEELLQAAEATLGWLYDRRAHLPEELLDHREARHRKALREAVRKVREPGLELGDGAFTRAMGRPEE